MAQIDVGVEATTILDGNEATDTLVIVGSRAIRIATGSPTGRTFENSAPIDRGQLIVFPAGSIVTGFANVGTAPVWVEAFGA